MKQAFVSFLWCAIFFAFSGPVHAQAYPTKPIKVIAPYPPGGVVDVIGRLLAARMSESLGQPVVVENKPGAAGTLGAGLVASAPPDGYTLLLASSSHTVSPSMYANLSWHPVRSFAPIVLVGDIPSAIIVLPTMPARTLEDLIGLAKSRPGTLNFSSAGSGSLIHLAMELLQQGAGIQLTHVPYKGQPPALTALISGDVQVMALTVALAKQRIDAGQVRALAVTSTKRWPGLADVPTVAERGFKGYEVSTWFGFMASAGTPERIVNQLNTAIVAATKHPEMEKKLREMGAELTVGTPQAFEAFLNADIERWAGVIKKAGIKGE